jgi:hypothetical protein
MRVGGNQNQPPDIATSSLSGLRWWVEGVEVARHPLGVCVGPM